VLTSYRLTLNSTKLCILNSINFYILKYRYKYNVRKWWLNMGWVLPCRQTLLLSRCPSCNSLCATWTQSFASYVIKAAEKKRFLLTDERCLPVHPSFCPHATARLTADGFPWNFVSGGLLPQFFNTSRVWWKSGRNNNLHENLRTSKISSRGFHNWDSHELRQKKQLTIWT